MRFIQGFTLIELLIVIAILGVLGAIIFVSIGGNPQAKARDVRRLADLNNIRQAVWLYYFDKGVFPARTSDSCCDGWDQGYCSADGSDGFIQPLVTEGYLPVVPGDPKFSGSCSGYSYYVYNAGSYGCDASRGKFFVLGIRNLEANANLSGSGWQCPSRNWQGEFDYVVGGFER